MQRFSIGHEGLDALIRVLGESGYEVFGPVVTDGAIRYAPVTGVDALPRGVGDDQGPGTYRLLQRDDDALFRYAVGPSSLKALLFPPRRTVWTAKKTSGSLEFTPHPAKAAPTAVIGARACELAAADVQDRVMLGGRYQDPDYAARRASLFLVAVNCTEPAATCFCPSVGTGPAATTGFDLAMTEVDVDGFYRLVGEVGSESGAEMLARVPHDRAADEELTMARMEVEAAAEKMTRVLPMTGLRDLLASNPSSERWDSIGNRCLACGNCTQVCPTCFCANTEDYASLDGTTTSRERRWDSCFSLDFSYMGGRPVRATVGARYRQWLTHKLSTWVDQFGVLGCVGCGRCITWCPVGIDLTEEVAAMRESEARSHA